MNDKEKLVKLLKLVKHQNENDYFEVGEIEYELNFFTQHFFNQNHLITTGQSLATFKDKIKNEINVDDKFEVDFKLIQKYANQASIIKNQSLAYNNADKDGGYNLLYIENEIQSKNVRPLHTKDIIKLVEHQLVKLIEEELNIAE